MKKQLKYLAPIIVSFATFTVFIEQSFIYGWMLYGLAIILTFFYYPQYFKSSVFIAIIVYILFVFVKFLLGDSYFNEIKTVYKEFVVLLVPTALTFMVLQKYDKIAVKYTIILFFIMLTYTTVVSFVMDLMQPGIIRRLAVVAFNGESTEVFQPYFKMGLSNYYLPHAIPPLILPVCLGIRNKDFKGKISIYLWIILFLMLLLSFLSGATTSLILSVIAVIMGFILRKGTLKDNLPLFVFLPVLLAVVLNKTILVQFLFLLENIFRDTYFHGKIILFQDALLYGDVTGGDAGERMELYDSSLNVFENNLLFGSNSKTLGHSSIFERLAHLGILGFLPFILVIFQQASLVMKHLERNGKSHYIVGLVLALAMITIKNMIYWEIMVVMFTLLPLSIIILGGHSTKKEIKISGSHQTSHLL